MRIVALRAQMITEHCGLNESGMIACKVSPSAVDQILAFEKVTPELAVACRNSNNDCVVSGPLDQLNHFKQICEIKPIKARMLEVPFFLVVSIVEKYLDICKLLFLAFMTYSLSVKWTIRIYKCFHMKKMCHVGGLCGNEAILTWGARGGTSHHAG